MFRHGRWRDPRTALRCNYLTQIAAWPGRVDIPVRQVQNRFQTKLFPRNWIGPQSCLDFPDRRSAETDPVTNPLLRYCVEIVPWTSIALDCSRISYKTEYSYAFNKPTFLVISLSFWCAPFAYLYFSIMNQNWVQESILAWLWPISIWYFGWDKIRTHNLSIKFGNH